MKIFSAQTFNLKKIGTCKYCMQKSFRFASVSIAVAALQFYVFGNPILNFILIFASVSLVLLWLSHIIFFARRRLAHRDIKFSFERRRHLGTVMRITAFGIAQAAMMSVAPISAHAKECSIQCDVSDASTTCQEHEECFCECASSGIGGCTCHQTH